MTISTAAATSTPFAAGMMFSSATNSYSPRVFFPTTLQVGHIRIGSSFLRASTTINAHPRVPASLCSSAFVNIPTVMDGISIARVIEKEIAAEISRMKESTGVVPGLGEILLEDIATDCSWGIEKDACESVGIKLHEMRVGEGCSQQELLKHISSFNDNPSINGIIIEGLLSHFNREKVLNAVCVEKDVQGFNALNISRLAMKDRQPLFVPCRPKGCIELLHRYGVAIKGKRAVVIGRDVVGMSTALLLQREDATVTVVHSRTRNPEEITREADILICALRQPNMVRGSWIKPGAVVIDAGINVIEDPIGPQEFRTVGDVCFLEASKIASIIAPHRRGVRHVANMMLLSNTLDAAKRAYNFK